MYRVKLSNLRAWEEIYICPINFRNEINRVKELNLVFKEYIGFLKDKGLPVELEEGYYWLDRQIIKAYDKSGKLHKILKMTVSDDLEISYKIYDNKPFEIESWQDTVKRNISKLSELESESLELIKQSKVKYNGYTDAILTSGGKDSSVTSHLVKIVNQGAISIFNNTTLDCAETYLHIKKEPHLIIINPKEGFYNWRERNNFVGNRLARACCTIFKENSMVETLDPETKMLFYMGMRNQESNTRSGYSDEWKNDKWGNRQWQGILPIRKWSEEEIWLYIVWRNIDINPKYKMGYNRVGCAVACPYYTKSTWVLDKYWYPLMYNRWHNILTNDFIKNKKAPILNCTLKEYHTNWNGTGVRDEPTEEVIQEFAEMQNLNIDVARKYFSKTCMCCDKKLKSIDIALSMKFYGRNIENFKCIKCISKDLGVKVKELRDRAKQFKNQGCDLF